MPNRITPYDEGGSIKRRINEIVMLKADVHFEMNSESSATIWIGDRETSKGGRHSRYGARSVFGMFRRQ